MANDLMGRKVAILVADGVEQVELTSPRDALEKAGAAVYIISPNEQTVKGWNHTEWGETFDVHVPLAQARPNDYDLLVLPGGVINPDKLRQNEQAVQFVKAFVEAGKPIASICHGPWTLIETGAVRGRRMTSYRSLKTDLTNAGAQWVDEPVVEDRGIITSRGPDDLDAFNAKLLDAAYQRRQAA